MSKYPSELLAARLAEIRKSAKIARDAYPHSDKWLNMYANDVEDMLNLIDSMLWPTLEEVDMLRTQTAAYRKESAARCQAGTAAQNRK